ncbi:DNA repair protein XRCC1 isoform X1 [Chamaea fasciata]|uniref:DNA repair protein XRCC1 isoform X1 n=1 Tax=Chamaea fasciata TaxID=190680 RepID=UPI00336A920B
MPEIPLTRVVSVSSADPRHPAENLLRPDDGGRWRGAAAGEKQLSVVLELGSSRPIHSLHVGNDGAAFVEILVGSSSGGDFQVLLPSAALMSPSESKAGLELHRVRMFGPESLVKGQAQAAWDRLKVVLSQPYCQSRPFGLSFVRVFSAPQEEEEEEKGGKGEVKLPRPRPLSVTPRPRSKTAPSPPSAASPPPAAEPRPKTSPPGPSPPEGAPKRLGGVAPGGVAPGGVAPGGAVLGGVVLALSGFQNPLRGKLRQAALGLGAQYRPDWSRDCTHLVCAFPRTPKAQRARLQGGVVVGPAWIWECQKLQRRLPCGPYLLDGSASSDSEGEEPEDAPPPPRPSPKVKKGAGPPQLDAPKAPPSAEPATPPESDESGDQSEGSDPYGGSTEENTEDDDDDEGEPIPPLPDFFEDKIFFFHGKFPEGEERRLRRTVVAFGGTLAPYMDDSVTHVVTSQDWDPAFQEALELRPSLTFVRPHWLLLCGERQSPLPATPFLVTPRA